MSLPTKLSPFPTLTLNDLEQALKDNKNYMHLCLVVTCICISSIYVHVCNNIINTEPNKKLRQYCASPFERIPHSVNTFYLRNPHEYPQKAIYRQNLNSQGYMMKLRTILLINIRLHYGREMCRND